MSRVAFVFPGQGSQQPGMLGNVPEHDDLGRLIDAAEALSGLELRQIAEQGGAGDLSDTRVAQPLLFLADWAWGMALSDSGIEPHAVAGHSLGELATLAFAGVFSVEAGLELVVERSKLMANVAAARPGAMSAVLGLEADRIAEAIASIEDVWVANDNAVGQVVISGATDAVAQAEDALTMAGARRVVPLAVSGAFHSPMMAPAGESFAKILAQTEFCNAAVPVYQNTSARPTVDAEEIRSRLMAQIVSPVRWTETMEAMVADGVDYLVEAGPGAVLTGLAKRVEGMSALSAETVGIERILEEVA